MILNIILAFIVSDIVFALYLSIVTKEKPSYGLGLYAKFTPGAIISEIRNKIAATVFSRNRAGAIIRNRITPVNRRSSLQTVARQRLASQSTAWRGLTQAQRDSWIAAAPNFPQQDNLGQTIFLSGEQLFVRSNINLIIIGQPAITDAPVPAVFSVTTLAINVLSSIAMTLDFTPTPVEAGFSLVIFATSGKSAGREFIQESEFRFIEVQAAASISPADIEAAYVLVFGTLPVTGLKVSFKAFLVENASGLASIPVRVTGIVA